MSVDDICCIKCKIILVNSELFEQINDYAMDIQRVSVDYYCLQCGKNESREKCKTMQIVLRNPIKCYICEHEFIMYIENGKILSDTECPENHKAAKYN